MRRCLWIACAIALATPPRAARAEDPCQGGEVAPPPAAPPPPPPTPAPAQLDDAYPEPEPEPEPDLERERDGSAERPDLDIAPTRPAKRRDILVEIPGERSFENKAILVGVLGAGLVVGAVGVYFNLDARDAADAVSADRPTGRAWTAERAALVERADRSSTRAGVAYAVGGALVAGAIIGWIVSAPKIERTIIRTGMVAPTRGGAVVGGTWRF